MKGLCQGFSHRNWPDQDINLEGFWTRTPRLGVAFNEVEMDLPVHSIVHYFHRVLVALIVESTQCSVRCVGGSGMEEWAGHAQRVQRRTDMHTRPRVVGMPPSPRRATRLETAQDHTNVANVHAQGSATPVTPMTLLTRPSMWYLDRRNNGDLVLYPGERLTDEFGRSILVTWHSVSTGLVRSNYDMSKRLAPGDVYTNLTDRDQFIRWRVVDPKPLVGTALDQHNWSLANNSVQALLATSNSIMGNMVPMTSTANIVPAKRSLPPTPDPEPNLRPVHSARLPLAPGAVHEATTPQNRPEHEDNSEGRSRKRRRGNDKSYHHAG